MTDNPIPCVPDTARLEPFRDLVAHNPHPLARRRDPGTPTADEWGMGNVSTRAVAYSCGHLTRDGRPLTHLHRPEELDLCARLANEVAARLAAFRVGEGVRVRPFWAAAVAGNPVTAEVTEPLVRRVFGGTLYPDLQFAVARLVPNPDSARTPKRRAPPRGRWPNALGLHVGLDDLPDPAGDLGAQQAAAWDAFADWFTAVPGLGGHATVGMGFSDADPGPEKPRLLLAITGAGSLVGAIGYQTQA